MGWTEVMRHGGGIPEVAEATASDYGNKGSWEGVGVNKLWSSLTLVEGYGWYLRWYISDCPPPPNNRGGCCKRNMDAATVPRSAILHTCLCVSATLY